MNNTASPDTPRRSRNRMMLVAIFALFLGTLLVAGLLRFSGWRPEGMKNNGELLKVPVDVREVIPHAADGSAYRWQPEARTWRIVVAPDADCGEPCAKLAHDMDTIWQLFGKDADRVHVLWLGEFPADAPRPDTLVEIESGDVLRAHLPRVDDPAGPPVYVLDPNGFVVLRYAPDFDPAGLRQDVARLLKLR